VDLGEAETTHSIQVRVVDNQGDAGHRVVVVKVIGRTDAPAGPAAPAGAIPSPKLALGPPPVGRVRRVITSALLTRVPDIAETAMAPFDQSWNPQAMRMLETAVPRRRST